MCKQYFGLEQGDQTVDEYYNQVVAICKERNLYQPFSMDLKKVEQQRQDVDVVWFILGLKPEFKLVRVQILGALNFPHFLKSFFGFNMLILLIMAFKYVISVLVRALLLLLLVVVMVVLMEDMAVVVVMVFVVDVIIGVEVTLKVVGLANTLIVVVLTILWISVGIYMAHYLGLPIRLLLTMISKLHLEHLLA